MKFSLRELLKLNTDEKDDFFDEEPVGHEEEEEEIRSSHLRRFLIIAVAAVILVAVLFGMVKYIVDHFHYRSYEVVSEKQGGDNGLAGFIALQDKILKYSNDGISLMDQDLTTIWNQSIVYGNPIAAVRGAYAVIYDRMGTDVSVFDRKGSVSSFKTDLPIITARLSGKGGVALILDDSTSAAVKYYSPSGSLIADIRGGASDKGQPVDVDLSENGELLAVSYLKAGDDGINAELAVYRFSGETVESGENLVYSNVYAGGVIPDVIIGEKRIIALRETGFTTYKTGSEIKEENTVSFDDNIISCFYNRRYIGFVFNNMGTSRRYLIKVYSFTGEEVFTTETDFIYNTITMEDDSILMHNSSEMAVYTMKGHQRYSGVISDGGINQVIRLSRNRYLTTGNTRTRILQLKVLNNGDGG